MYPGFESDKHLPLVLSDQVNSSGRAVVVGRRDLGKAEVTSCVVVISCVNVCVIECIRCHNLPGPDSACVVCGSSYWRMVSAGQPGQGTEGTAPGQGHRSGWSVLHNVTWVGREPPLALMVGRP